MRSAAANHRFIRDSEKETVESGLDENGAVKTCAQLSWKRSTIRLP